MNTPHTEVTVLVPPQRPAPAAAWLLGTAAALLLQAIAAPLPVLRRIATALSVARTSARAELIRQA